MKFNFSINKMRELVLKYPFLKPFDKEISRQLLEEIEREIEKLNKAINEMGEFLINAANTYQRVNETNQDGIM